MPALHVADLVTDHEKQFIVGQLIAGGRSEHQKRVFHSRQDRIDVTLRSDENLRPDRDVENFACFIDLLVDFRKVIRVDAKIAAGELNPQEALQAVFVGFFDEDSESGRILEDV